DALVLANREKAQSQRQLVESNIVRAITMSGSGRIGQRLDGLKAIAESVPLADAAAMSPETRSRLRNAAISCLANPDIEVVAEHKLSEQYEFRVCVSERLNALAYQEESGKPVRRAEITPGLADIVYGDSRATLGKDQRVDQMKLSPDGRYLATVAWDRNGNKWLQITESRTGQVGFQSSDNQIAFPYDHLFEFAPSGKQFAFASTGGGLSVLKVDQEQWHLERVVESGHPILCMTFDPRNENLVVALATDDGPIVRVLASPDYDETITELTLVKTPKRLAASRDGTLAVCSGRRTVEVYQVDSGHRFCRFVTIGEAQAMDIDSDGSILAIDAQNDTTLWDARTGIQLMQYHGKFQSICDDHLVCTLPSGRLVILRIVKSDVYGGIGQRRITEINAIHPRLPLLFTGSQFDNGSGIHVWNTDTGTLLAELMLGNVYDMKVSHDGRRLFTSSQAASPAQVLQAWPLRIDAETMRIGPPEEIAWTSNLAPSFISLDANDEILAVQAAWGSEFGIGFVDLTSGKLSKLVKAPYGARFSAMTGDGKWAATGNWHGKESAIYDVTKGSIVRPLVTGISRVNFSADGRFLFCGDGMFKVGNWNQKRTIDHDWELRYFGAISSSRFSLAVFPRANPYNGSLLVQTESWNPIAELMSNRLAEAYCYPMAIAADGGSVVVSVMDQARAIAKVALEDEKLAPTVDAFSIYRWNLRALRGHLRQLGLDLDAPPVEERETDAINHVEFVQGE
ncbi:MAG: WD40 repeat domain-containing protein, partial [Planctomycetales bacterium]|nr:WD40 repeat domain-containing protein [Planctomycetales bacterium]